MRALEALCLPGHAVTVDRIHTATRDGWGARCSCGARRRAARLSGALRLEHQVDQLRARLGAA